jgi:hypothetical protein
MIWTIEPETPNSFQLHELMQDPAQMWALQKDLVMNFRARLFDKAVVLTIKE